MRRIAHAASRVAQSQCIERLPGAVREVVGGALGMLPAEGREDHVAEPSNGLSPAISVTAQPKSLRMERGHGKLDFRPLAGVSRSIQGNGVVRHCPGILTVVRLRQGAGRSDIDAHR